MTSTTHTLLMGFITAVMLVLLWRAEGGAAMALLVPLGVAQLGLGGCAALFAQGDGFNKMNLLALTVFLHFPLLLAGAVARFVRSHRRTALVCGVVLASILAVAVDAFLIEPHWLDVSHLTLTSPKITSPVRIALIADIQTDAPGDYERRVFEQVRSAQPDLIAFAGDYIHLGRRSRSYDEEAHALNAILHNADLAAPLGMVAVMGNVDWVGDWSQVFAGLPVTLVDETATFDLGPLALTGLGMWDSFSPDVAVAPYDKFHVVLGHSPNFSLGNVGADLLLAGHTHGGQVQLPLFGPVLTLSAVPRAWAAGVTAIDSGKTLVVSRGIGMERGAAPRLRFLCRPELVIIDLLPESAN